MSENEKHEHEHKHECCEHEHHHEHRCDKKEKDCCDKHEVCEQYEKNVKKIGKILCHKEEEKCECKDKHHHDDDCDDDDKHEEHHESDKCCLIRELFGKEIEEKEERIREALKHLLKNFIKFQLWIDAEERRLERLECEKMKEFNCAAEELFEKLECVEEFEEEVCEALSCEKEECEEEDDDDDDHDHDHGHDKDDKIKKEMKDAFDDKSKGKGKK